MQFSTLIEHLRHEWRQVAQTTDAVVSWKYPVWQSQLEPTNPRKEFEGQDLQVVAAV
jgi:hypothetical protein